MFSSTLQQELREQLEHLPPEKQQRVVELARSLASSTPKGVPGRDMMHIVGTMSAEDAEEMSQAIEEGCERIDADGW